MTDPQAFELALQHHRAGRLADAEALYRQILAAQPHHAGALHLLGVIVHQAGRHELAADLIRQSLALKPNNHSAHCNLGVACQAMGRLDEAIAAYNRALALEPDFLEAQINLGAAYSERGQLDEAIAAYRRMLRVSPNYPAIHNNLGNALRDRGQLDQAIAAYRRALQLRPDDAWAHDNLIFTLHYHPGHDAATIAEEQQRWNRRFGEPLSQFSQTHANEPAVARRLRVGYVSADFRDHAVGFYVRIAVKLATDLPRLADLRATLRARMLACSLPRSWTPHALRKTSKPPTVPCGSAGARDNHPHAKVKRPEPTFEIPNPN